MKLIKIFSLLLLSHPFPQIAVAETAQEERNAVHTGGPLWSQRLLRTPIPHTVASANSSGGGKRLSREREAGVKWQPNGESKGPWIAECYYLMPAQVLSQDLNKVTKADFFLRPLCCIISKTNTWETKMGISLILMYWGVAAKTLWMNLKFQNENLSVNDWHHSLQRDSRVSVVIQSAGSALKSLLPKTDKTIDTNILYCVWNWHLKTCSPSLICSD